MSKTDINKIAVPLLACGSAGGKAADKCSDDELAHIVAKSKLARAAAANFRNTAVTFRGGGGGLRCFHSPVTGVDVYMCGDTL